MALFSLKKMASGGVVDQLGGGFCRYSVDEQWAIPHFEKMLYDNGPLLHLYADAWALTGEPLFADTAVGIVDWLLREMRAPEGDFIPRSMPTAKATKASSTCGHRSRCERC
jgi:uncharacterized protein